MLSHSNKLLFRRQGLVVAGAVPTGLCGWEHNCAIFHVFLLGGVGWVGGMLTFPACCTDCGCYATAGWGWVGRWDANVPCVLHRLWMLRYTAGWGWVVGWLEPHVNVPCMLHRQWMLRYSWVGLGRWVKMLTFPACCTDCACYATQLCGLASGMLTFHCKIHGLWMLL